MTEKQQVSPALLNLLHSKIDEVLPRVIELRQAIHREPELGLETHKTAAKIREFLQESSLEFRKPLLGGDLIAEIECGSRRVCLRADIDAVPLVEKTGKPYCSQVLGVMHACGHDGHAAILAGAAYVLSVLREHIKSSVRFVFQPGEEMVFGGKTLVSMGACDGCESAYALHGWPGLPVGCISTRKGVMFAAGAEVTINIHGKSCHGAAPEKGANPIPVAAEIITRIQSYAEKLRLENGSVASICAINSGSTGNVIPDTATLSGTVRYLSLEHGKAIEETLTQLIQNCAKPGIRTELLFEETYNLPVINTDHGYEAVRQTALSYFPEATWHEAEKPSMAMEDFAYYLENRDGAMFWLGLGENHPPLHSSDFDFNENAMRNGILMMCLLAME